jgi:hypothetical protein
LSDLTTLATLERVLERAKDRVQYDRHLDPSALNVLEVILEELHKELRPAQTPSGSSLGPRSSDPEDARLL